MKIVVLDGYAMNPGDNPWRPVEALGEVVVHDRTPGDKIVERSLGADILVTNKTVLKADVLGQLPDLKFITILATGYNVVDVAAARRRGVPVSNVPAYSTDSVAQLVFALLLEMCFQVGLHDASVKKGEWSNSVAFCYWKTPLVELAGKTMGIVGFGQIGRRVGELAHAFGMKVIAYNPSEKAGPEYRPFAWVGLDEVFEQADVVSMHCPLKDENAGMVNKGLLGKMRCGAFFINTARGGLVNERDLADALNTGKIAGAAADVVSVEPIEAGNPLLKARNCILTPHIAWGTLAARQRLMRATAENIAAFIKGEPVNVVN